MSGPIELGQLAAVPEEHRRLIAAWLAQSAARLRPSWVLSEECHRTAQQFLFGAAADLANPDEDERDVAHSNETVAGLLAQYPD